MSREHVSRTGRRLVHLRLCFKAIRQSWKLTTNLPRMVRALVHLLDKNVRNPFFGPQSNLYKVDGKYYWNLYTPGFPSPAFDRVFNRWLAHHLGFFPTRGLCTGFIAMTRKCALNCEHCFEWKSLNQTESLSDSDLLHMVHRLHELGAGQIILTGGEPLNRFSSVIRLLREFSNRGLQFWINTSAISLTESRLNELKSAGLTGIIFSLDHHDEHEHDRFRGREGLYRRVVASVRIANEVGLVTALSLCATNAFVSPENIGAYTRLAVRMEAVFIQVLEPQPVGRYEEKDVALVPGKQRQLEALFWDSVRSGSASSSLPIVCYPEYQKRTTGCIGGEMYVYVNPDGRISPCPFCKRNPVPIDELSPANLVSKLKCPQPAHPAMKS